MASYPSGHALVLDQTQVGLTIEAERATRSMAFVTDDPMGAFVHLKDLSGTKRGATLKPRFKPMRHGDDLRVLARGATIVGNEDTRTEHETSISLDFVTLATGRIDEIHDQQFIDFEILDNEQMAMVREASELLETMFMNHLAGYTVKNNVVSTPGEHPFGKNGCNPVFEPDTAHHFFGLGQTTEAGVAGDSTAIVTNRIVEESLDKLQSLDYSNVHPLSPAVTPFGERYIYIDNNEGLRQIKENNTDSDVFTLGQSLLQGGMDPKTSTLIVGQGFELNDIIYLKSDYTPFGTSGGTAGAASEGTTKRSNVKRGMLFGHRAIQVLWGESFASGVHLGYSEHQVHTTLSMRIFSILGINATIVNGQRWGSAVISHYNSV